MNHAGKCAKRNGRIVTEWQVGTESRYKLVPYKRACVRTYTGIIDLCVDGNLQQGNSTRCVQIVRTFLNTTNPSPSNCNLSLFDRTNPQGIHGPVTRIKNERSRLRGTSAASFHFFFFMALGFNFTGRTNEISQMPFGVPVRAAFSASSIWTRFMHKVIGPIVWNFISVVMKGNWKGRISRFYWNTRYVQIP